MKRPKKPTLAQLKKRPAWWIDRYFFVVAISYPNGTVEWVYRGTWARSSYDVKDITTFMTFGGWIENG